MMHLDGDEQPSGEQSYEDLCRAHIDTMLAAAAAREVRPTLLLCCGVVIASQGAMFYY